MQILWCQLLSLNITLDKFSIFLHMVLTIFIAKRFHWIIVPIYPSYVDGYAMSNFWLLWMLPWSCLLWHMYMYFCWGYIKSTIADLDLSTKRTHLLYHIHNQKLWQRKHGLECQVWCGTNIPVWFHKLLNFSQMSFHFLLLTCYSLCLE